MGITMQKIQKYMFLEISKIILFILFFHSTLTCAQDNQIINPSSIDLKNEIVLGMSGMMSGQLGLYGTIIKQGIETYFNQVNEEGGINSKRLRLICLDDQGDPIQAVQNVEKLINLGIRMFIGNMGTRSVLKILPLIKDKKIALFFPWGSDEKLRDRNLSHIINGPGLLEPQLEALVNHIITTSGQQKIGIFSADDPFSQHGTQFLINQLHKHSIAPTIHKSYNRFTLDILPIADKIIAIDPKIVISISTSMPTARLINRFFERGHYGTTFFGVDSTLFTGKLLASRNANFSYSSAVPNPCTSQLVVAQNYRKSLKKYFPNESPNILSLTYYLCAHIIGNALKTSDCQTPEIILKNIEAMINYNLEGFIVDFNLENRHAFGSNTFIIKGQS